MNETLKEKETNKTAQDKGSDPQRLASCKLCNETPRVSEYETDSGGGTSGTACITCECGNSVCKDTTDIKQGKIIPNYEGHGKTGWDIAESLWKQAMHDALTDWNKLNS